MGRVNIFLICLLASLLFGSTFSGPVGAVRAGQWEGREEIIDGTLNILNPDGPLLPPATIKAKELWRIGDEDDESGELIGYISDIKRDEAGNYYLLDTSLSVLKVYSPTGEFIRDLGREGEGPGEFRQPDNFVFLNSGKIAVSQLMPGRLITIDTEGIPTGNIELAEGGMGMQLLHKLAGSNGHAVASVMIPTIANGRVSTTQRMFSVDSEGNTVATFYDDTDDQSGDSHGGGISIRVDPTGSDVSRHWTVGNDGQVYLAKKYNSYEIEVFAPDGKLRHVIQRDYKSVKLPDEAIESRRQQMADAAASMGDANLVQDINPMDRDIAMLYARPGGELWVETSASRRASREGGIRDFDVFDNDGRFQRRLSIDIDYDAGRDNFIIDGNRLYVLKEAQNTPRSSSFSGGGGGGAVVLRIGGPPAQADEDDDEEAKPFSVVCYELSN